jgi:hypothetical protein
LTASGRSNFDTRFGGPVFKAIEHKKIPFYFRYPRLTLATMSAMTVYGLFGQLIYDAFFAPAPVWTAEMHERQKKLDEAYKGFALAPITNTMARVRKKEEIAEVVVKEE